MSFAFPWQTLADRIAARDGGWRCHYCSGALFSTKDPMPYWPSEGRTIPTIDHKLPRSRGGTDALDNLVLACNKCNARKRNLTDEEYNDWLETHAVRR